MKEIQWRDSTPESVRQTGTPSAAKENFRLHGVAYTPMTANKHTTLFDGGVVKQAPPRCKLWQTMIHKKSSC